MFDPSSWLKLTSNLEVQNLSPFSGGLYNLPLFFSKLADQNLKF